VPAKKRGKGVLVALIVLVVLAGGVFAGHYLGFYTLPFLTDTVNTVSVLETTGTVDIERSSDTLAARVGMRLMNLDTVRTGGASSAWLSLDSDKAIGLAEQTSLRVDQSARGFELTLVAGEIRAQIDKPLADGEDFTVQAGNLALAVRGTVFTANYRDSLLKVQVESGSVAVLDAQGRELAVLGAGESGAYEAGETAEEEEQAGEPEQPPDGEAGLPPLESGILDVFFSTPLSGYADAPGLFGFFWELHIVFYVDDRALDTFTLSQDDVKDLTIYIDGTPYPVPILTFYGVDRDRISRVGREAEIPYSEVYCVILFAEVGDFEQYPAVYGASCTVKGIEIPESPVLEVYADRTAERIRPDGSRETFVPR
jgi:hypothetical protein